MSGKRKRSNIKGGRGTSARPMSAPSVGLPALGPDGIDLAMSAARRFWDVQNAVWQTKQFGGQP